MNNIEQIVADLRTQNLDENQILAALEQMLTEGKITAEDLEKAKALLGAQTQALAPETPEQEKCRAGDLFGLKLL